MILVVHFKFSKELNVKKRFKRYPALTILIFEYCIYIGYARQSNMHQCQILKNSLIWVYRSKQYNIDKYKIDR